MSIILGEGKRLRDGASELCKVVDKQQPIDAFQIRRSGRDLKGFGCTRKVNDRSTNSNLPPKLNHLSELTEAMLHSSEVKNVA